MLTPDLGAGAVSSQINSRRMSSDDYICYFTTFWTTHLTSSFYLHSLLFLSVLVQPSLLLCFPFDAKAKFYRRESEVLSNIYRRPIEHLSKTYRTSIEDLSKTYRISIEDLSKRACVNCFIHLHMVCRLHRIMGKSSCIFLLTIDFSVRIFKALIPQHFDLTLFISS